MPAPECRVRGSCWRPGARWEVEGGRESGGPNGSGRPLTFMELMAPLLLLLLLLVLLPEPLLTVMLLARPREAESYSECLRSGSLVCLGPWSLSPGLGWPWVTPEAGVRPTGGRLVLEPASYPVQVERRSPLLGMETGG